MSVLSGGGFPYLTLVSLHHYSSRWSRGGSSGGCPGAERVCSWHYLIPGSFLSHSFGNYFLSTGYGHGTNLDQVPVLEQFTFQWETRETKQSKCVSCQLLTQGNKMNQGRGQRKCSWKGEI